ncbi:MAG: LysR family transcriptional regulator [Pseudomonadota bacterium]
MDRWTEIRTAYQVAKLGTVSAAAVAMKVHRATIIRRIDALEKELEAKVFHRHSKGYTPTEIGLDLLKVARLTDDQFAQFLGRSKGSTTELSGDLIVTSTDMLTNTMMPVIRRYQTEHPDVVVRYLVGPEIARLEYGDAHIAVRTGPSQFAPDNIALPFVTVRSALYAHRDYIEKFGKPETVKDFADHRFISRDRDEEQFVLFKWLQKHVPDQNIIFRSADMNTKFSALFSGLGIAFLPVHEARVRPNLVEVMPPKRLWDVNFSVVTHIDLHRSTKVQSFLECLRKEGYLRSRNQVGEPKPNRAGYTEL